MLYYVETSYNQKTYQISGLPAGTHLVVAYTLGGGSFPVGLAGGYTQAVVCGLRVDCTDHALIEFPVNSGQTVTEVDPGDWYASEGTFPPAPVLP